jgi:hypothetical protein
MSESVSEMVTVSYNPCDDDYLMPSGSYTISLADIDLTTCNELTLNQQWSWQPKTQLDLFDRLIESSSVAQSSLFMYEDEDGVESTADYYIKTKEYLQDCKASGWLKVTFDEESQHHRFWFVGSDADYTWWKMRWSEYFDQLFVNRL